MVEEAAPVEVRLLGLPLHIRSAFVQHTEELMRELALVQLEAEQGAGQDVETPLAPRLLQVAAELAGAYASFQSQPSAVVNAALAAGEDHCDVTYTLARPVDSSAQRLAQLLEEADDFCCSEEYLLTLPASQEVVAYRRWVSEEFQRQLGGRAARPWHRRLPAAAGAAEMAVAAVPRRAAAPGGAGAPLPPARRGEDEREGGRGEVVGRPLVLESLASSVSAARHYVRRVLGELGAQALEESAELGVSELVSNAVLHARTSFTVTVRTMLTGRVRIEVDDSSAAPVQPRHFSVAATTGRGLQLVASLSFEWGIEGRAGAQGSGKTVWFEPKEITSTFDVAGGFGAGDWGLELESSL